MRLCTIYHLGKTDARHAKYRAITPMSAKAILLRIMPRQKDNRHEHPGAAMVMPCNVYVDAGTDPERRAAKPDGVSGFSFVVQEFSTP